MPSTPPPSPPSPSTPPTPPTTRWCGSHPHLEATYYCLTCHTPPVCSECVVHGVHTGHSTLLVEQAASHLTPGLLTLLAQIERAEGVGAKLGASLGERRGEAVGRLDRCVEDANAVFDALIQAVEKTRGEVVERIAGAREEHLEGIDVLEKERVALGVRLEEVRDAVGAALEESGTGDNRFAVLDVYAAGSPAVVDDVESALIDLVDEAGNPTTHGSDAGLDVLVSDATISPVPVQLALNDILSSSTTTLSPQRLPRRRLSSHHLSSSSPPPQLHDPGTSPLRLASSARLATVRARSPSPAVPPPSSPPPLSPTKARVEANTSRFQKLLEGYESEHQARIRDRRHSRRAAALHASHSPSKLLFHTRQRTPHAPHTPHTPHTP